jgi:hypothetical protein
MASDASYRWADAADLDPSKDVRLELISLLALLGSFCHKAK